MQMRSFHGVPGAPARVPGVTPSYNPADLVEIDLNTPQNPSQVFQSPGTDLGSCPQNPTSGTQDGSTAATDDVANPYPTLPIPGSMGTNHNRVYGNPDMVPSSNPSVGTNPLSVTTSGTAEPLSSRRTSEAQTRTTENQGGRGHAGSGCKCLSPPADLTAASAVAPYANIDIRVALITEAAAKQAFLEYGKSQCCYSTAPAKQMTLRELQPFNAYRYYLETFTESRACDWVTELYTGQAVDSSPNGSAPQPWDIPTAVPNIFQNGTQKMVVPNTLSVKACSRCNGLGRNMCLKCHGTGRVQCMWCNGTGRRMQMEMCQSCYGNGTERKNNIFEFISDYNTEFAKDLFKDVTGERIFTEEQLSVSPLANFPDLSLTRASQNALEQHQMQFSSSCRVLRQRQSIELLPLTKVQYIWKDNQLSYFVYGKEDKIHVKNYPQKCCCLVQ
ncbi:protein SSUH2 homolog isoform X2 [Mixophyes fleayi]|uniref:protein SSUH2 homolog isoform X2 n=1 Tax=Mixophyes fleayi TaxID=3061075 RepID=UPI003F4DC53E